MYSSFSGNKPQKSGAPPSAASLKNYQFDFGVGTGFSNQGTSRPLRDQKSPSPAPPPSRTPSSSTPPATRASTKSSWIHQPSTGQSGQGSSLSNPTSMVGDIFGKSWASTTSSGASGIGISKSDPSLFGDLVGSAFGQAKGTGGSNVPLKNAPPRSSYAMGNLADSLPRTTPDVAANSGKPSGRGSGDNRGGYHPSAASNFGGMMGTTGGGQPMKSSTSATAGVKKDPFESLMDFGRAKSANTSPIPNTSSVPIDLNKGDYTSMKFQDASRDKVRNGDPQFDDFGMPPPVQDLPSKQPPAAQPVSCVDPLDVLFSSSVSSHAAAPAEGAESQPFMADDWDLGAEFGDHDSGATTTELEGLPPPPAGVTSSIAKTKGLENQKQGQFADAIKWLSWAIVLLEKSGDTSATIEVLVCRASCYKEVGEYKKAVADCSRVLDHDNTNIAVLLQRALLYESTEKYKLGAEDLRAVLRIDPGNRLAKSTIHRLSQMAG